MDYLTVKEVAALKGCTERYIKRLCKEGKIKAEKQFNPEIKQTCYMISASSLPKELQIKYYDNLKSEMNLPDLKEEKTAIKQCKNTISKTFEELSEIERKEANMWADIIKEWLGVRCQYKNKAQADENFVGKCRLDHPGLQVSRDILYRKLRAYKEDNAYGLIDKRGAWNKGNRCIEPIIWEEFLYCWLDENQPTAAKCYKETIEWTEFFYPELVSSIPSLRTFQRHIQTDVKKAVKVLMREGEKAFSDRCMPYVTRLYDKLEANDCWIADNHTLDIQSINEDGGIHRLYITAFLDAKSGVLVGWNITDTPNSWSTIVALRHGIKRFGIPKCVYFDNGREFLTHDIGGNGNRTKKNTPAANPLTILQRLGIEMHDAQVRNAKAKPIERTFGTLKSQFSKTFSGYCGGTIFERPESLKRRIKNGDLPMDFEIRTFIDAWIDGDYNLQLYGGAETKYKDMTRIDVWNKSIRQVRVADEPELNLMLMRSTKFQKVKRNGVYVDIFGEKIWYMDTKETVMNLDKVVSVRYDPVDLSSVRIYDEQDRYLFTWKLADMLLVDYIENVKERISDSQKVISTVRKFVKEQAAGITANLTNEQKITMLDISMRRNFKNAKERFKVEFPTNIIPIKANEPMDDDVKKAAGAEHAVVIDLNKIEKNYLKRKDD